MGHALKSATANLLAGLQRQRDAVDEQINVAVMVLALEKGIPLESIAGIAPDGQLIIKEPEHDSLAMSAPLRSEDTLSPPE